MKRACLIALAVLAACRAPERKQTIGDPPIIIVSIDTLRADHLPAYGYGAVQTPNIDALRADSILYSNAYANVPLTFPSHVSMLTGLLPPEHKVRNNIGYALDPALPTIPKALKSKGYATGAAISAYVLRGNIGLASSFDFYDDGIVSRADIPVGNLQRHGRETAAIARRWIGEKKGAPFFFFLHLFEPHSPYEPPEPFRSRFANAYDGEIATADDILGNFIGFLKSEEIYDRAVIIMMSDHGEGLYQHGEPEHGIFVYRENIHVPLLVKLPERERAGETEERPVSLTDIFPTIAALTGAPLPPNAHGTSLLNPDEPKSARHVYSESLYGRIHLGWSELRSLIGDDFHFIQAPRPELYDVHRDPAETKNILTEERRAYAAMRDELARYGTAIEAPQRIDPEEAKKLAALGYLGSAQPAAAGPLPDPKDRIGEVREMMEAMRLVQENNHAAAIPAFRRIIEKNPRLVDAWTQLGTSQETLGRYEEAADTYRKAIEISPELAGEFGLRLGSVYLRLERFDEAEKHAELGEKTNYGGSHLLRARIAMGRKDYKTSEKQAKIAEGDQFSRVAAKIVRAQGYSQQDRPAEALAILEDVAREAEERKLGSVESLQFVRGDALARLERYPEAIEAFNREIAAFPRDRQAYASLYLVYMLTNRPQEANGALEAMVRANPNRRAYLFGASTLDAVGDKRGASEWRRRAASMK